MPKLAELHPHRIRDICTTLKNQRHLLLAFTYVLDKQFRAISLEFECTPQTVWQVCQWKHKYFVGNEPFYNSL